MNVRVWRFLFSTDRNSAERCRRCGPRAVHVMGNFLKIHEASTDGKTNRMFLLSTWLEMRPAQLEQQCGISFEPIERESGIRRILTLAIWHGLNTVSRRGGNVMPILTLIACIALCVFARPVSGQESVDEFFQELFLGESVYPQEAKELQLTTGFFAAHDGRNNYRLPVLIEYGLTDRFQIGVEVPIDFQHAGDKNASGAGQIEFETYWNVLNEPDSGWASGVGFALGIPSATPDVGEDSFVYEPFFVAYKQTSDVAVNVSATVEVEEQTDHREGNEIGSELAFAIMKRSEQVVFLLETGTEIESGGTQVRAAPGMYFHPPSRDWELGVSLPVGLTPDVPGIGAFVLFTREFGGR